VNAASTGKFLVKRCENWSLKSEKKAEIKTEVGNPDGAGVVRKPGGVTGTFTVFTEQGTLATMLANFRALESSEEWFSITKQIVGGSRDQYPWCQVSSVDEDGDNEGSNKFNVEIVALFRSPL
jgi:hypothetical protein